jgi:uncharacterized membrane protein YeaQ/YmgE (transglycosylase-associated protein family)
MTLIDFLLLLAVAAVCGLIAQAIVGVSLGGCLVSAVVGFIGALVGMWVGPANWDCRNSWPFTSAVNPSRWSGRSSDRRCCW